MHEKNTELSLNNNYDHGWDEIAVPTKLALEDKEKTKAKSLIEQSNELRRAMGYQEDPEIIDVEESELRYIEEEQAKELELALQQEYEEQLAKEEELQRINQELKDLDELERINQELKELDELEELEQINQELAALDALESDQAAGAGTSEIKDIDFTPVIEDSPLVAINADWTHDLHEMAHDLAERELNAEVAEGKFIKKLWKGTLLKKYYEKSYEKQFLAGRKDSQGKSAMDYIKEQEPAVTARFILGATEDISYIHEKIGKRNEDGTYDNGEKLIEVDEKTNQEIRLAIEDYAYRQVDLGEKVSDLDRDFQDNIARIIQEHIDGGAKSNNYLKVAKEAAKRYEKVAINARSKAEHEAAMAKVMAGFKAYDAEVRSNVRTDAHKDAIDKIVDKLESSKIGQFIPAEILAGAAGVVAGLTQTGVRAVLGAAGGIIASSAISGLKERNRVTEDRVRMMRDIASGMGYKKNSNYEQEIGGTLYDTRNASDLTANIYAALDPDNHPSPDDIIRAIAEARVRIDYSDRTQKDLISYSSPAQRGTERLNLDIAVIEAEKLLSEEDKIILDIMKDEIHNNIINGYRDEAGEYHTGVLEQDEDFSNLRTLYAVKKAGKTLALGTAIFFGSQEVMAALDPHKIGIFEKFGLIKTQNDANASETILASSFGGHGEYTTTGFSKETINNISDPNEVAKYESAGYTKVETTAGWSETTETINQVDPAASSARVDLKYDGWASNSTKFSDAHIENGRFVSNLHDSFIMGGKTINYDATDVKAYLTIGDSKFEIAGTLNESGQFTWGENGVFTTTTGETIKAIGDNGEKLYRYFEIAADNGVDMDGVQHIIPLATDVGTNTFSGKIEQVVQNVIEHPATYSFYKTIPTSETFIRDINFAGIGFAPETARTGLGAATAAATAPEAAPATPEPAPEATMAAPEAPEAAPAIESTPAAPEAPAAAESSNNAEFNNWSNGIINEIIANRYLIGGEDGIKIMTDPGKISKEAQDRWEKWWASLSQEGKQFAKSISEKIQASKYRYNLNWGNGIRSWLAANA